MRRFRFVVLGPSHTMAMNPSRTSDRLDAATPRQRSPLRPPARMDRPLDHRAFVAAGRRSERERAERGGDARGDAGVGYPADARRLPAPRAGEAADGLRSAREPRDAARRAACDLASLR